MPPRMPLTYFGGQRYRDPYQWLVRMPLALVQTDGSFHQRNRSGAVAAILDLPVGSKHQFVNQLYALESSTEAEWASVYYGLSLAINMEQRLIGLENDCLGVVQNILFNQPNRHEYARYYNHKIQGLAQKTDWCGIRWIPRGLNKADRLFRTNDILPKLE